VKIPLNRHSSKPIYLQIRDRLSVLIKSGMLQPGTRLPSVRSLAENVRVNKLTVLEAYSALEAEGLIYVRQRAGYFVSNGATSSIESESTFAPIQEVIIQEQGSGSFFLFSLGKSYMLIKALEEAGSPLRGFLKGHCIYSCRN